MLHLSSADYALDIEPEAGGAIARFDWAGAPLMRPRCGAGPLNSACFPLVPFSNRIAFGRFSAHGGAVQLAPNFPSADHPHPLHGFGWLNAWSIESDDGASATLRYAHESNAWPWAFEAHQRFAISEEGLRHDLSVRNLGDTPMPAGLGFHPYFPRTRQTHYLGLHSGEWETSGDGLPLRLKHAPEPRDWWDGQPVGARAVDTLYVGRKGPLSITWAECGLALTLAASPALDFTVVYSPPDADFFCVEPVSHETDAVNRSNTETGLRWLAPEETFSVHVTYSANKVRAIETA